jgi:hypothetical protein
MTPKCLLWATTLCGAFVSLECGCGFKSASVPSGRSHEHAPSAPTLTSGIGEGGLLDGKPTPPPATAGGDAHASINRLIVRTAEMSLETDSPDAAQKKVKALAESKGGFILTSETNRYEDGSSKERVSTTVVFRVPTAAFDATIETLRTIGSHVWNEKVAAQDVTEEYVDVEARLKAQRAIEEQFLAILKEPKSVHDILDVQQKLGEVRTEIERVEGRRRYLESQASESTITVHLESHVDAVDLEGPGFGKSVRLAARDVVSVGIDIVNGVIRLVGYLIPIGLLIVLPLYLLLRAAIRRRHRKRQAAGAP